MLPNKEMLEAIATRRCVTATYNRDVITLAPHILYTRHGEVHADGVTLERNGAAPKEYKLGTYKLAGLHDVAVTARAFEPDAGFNPAAEKYEGVTLFVVDRA
ncbi:MAG: hypothetical protein V4659_01235 [Pseudomonadota bacterium]